MQLNWLSVYGGPQTMRPMQGELLGVTLTEMLEELLSVDEIEAVADDELVDVGDADDEEDCDELGVTDDVVVAETVLEGVTLGLLEMQMQL